MTAHLKVCFPGAMATLQDFGRSGLRKLGGREVAKPDAAAVDAQLRAEQYVPQQHGADEGAAGLGEEGDRHRHQEHRRQPDQPVRLEPQEVVVDDAAQHQRLIGGVFDASVDLREILKRHTGGLTLDETKIG